MLEKRVLIGACADRVGDVVDLFGWVDTKRDHGKLTFIDLRDRSGKVQCVGFQKMGELTTESVIHITGLVKQRPPKLVNENLPLGAIEVDVQEYEVLNKADELPIPIDGDGHDIREDARLQYRYLDLRRERMRNMLKLRSEFVNAMRQAFFERDFRDVETPMLTKSTKEGARDFVIPSRFYPGKFYALPQSPQQYKQLLMTAGVENYFQFARCVRDEDLRADRGFEFTQVDVEMSFVDRQDVMQTIEAVVKESVLAVGGKLKDQTFPVYTYAEAKKQFGEDKFDLRTEEDRAEKRLAFAWVVDFPFFKEVDKKDAAEIRDGKSGWTFTHNPFSKPKDEFIEQHLEGKDVGEILTTQYDLVCNGYEVGGGSIRSHTPELLQATFKIMGYSDAQIEENVGHMLKAFSLGTPPHGGIALGLDRLIMLLTGETSLKEGIPFPMTSSGRVAVMDAPTDILPEQLAELGLAIKTK